MARPYASQLQFMQQKYLKDNTSTSLFNEIYMDNFGDIWDDHVRHKTLHSFANLQFEAEKKTWEMIWPHTTFPGINPAVLYDGSTWNRIHEEGMKLNMKKFQNSWMACLLEAQEKFPDERTEIHQYEAEKLWWNLRWPRENFPGIDPRPFLDPRNTDLASWEDIERLQKATEKGNPKQTQPTQPTYGPHNPPAAKGDKVGPGQNVTTKRECDEERETQFMIELHEKLM